MLTQLIRWLRRGGHYILSDFQGTLVILFLQVLILWAVLYNGTVSFIQLGDAIAVVIVASIGLTIANLVRLKLLVKVGKEPIEQLNDNIMILLRTFHEDHERLLEALREKEDKQVKPSS